MLYSETLMDHFQHPRNIGEMESPDAVGRVQSSVCGDTTVIYLAIEDGAIRDIRFKTFGCAPAIASSSMLTELAKGLTLEEAAAIDNKQVVEALGGMPDFMAHCSVLAADALKAAIAAYENRADAEEDEQSAE